MPATTIPRLDITEAEIAKRYLKMKLVRAVDIANGEPTFDDYERMVAVLRSEVDLVARHLFDRTLVGRVAGREALAHAVSLLRQMDRDHFRDPGYRGDYKADAPDAPERPALASRRAGTGE